MSKMLTGWKGKPSLRCVLRKSGGEFEYHLGMKQTSLPLANMTEIPALSELSLFNDTIPPSNVLVYQFNLYSNKTNALWRAKFKESNWVPTCRTFIWPLSSTGNESPGRYTTYTYVVVLSRWLQIQFQTIIAWRPLATLFIGNKQHTYFDLGKEKESNTKLDINYSSLLKWLSCEVKISPNEWAKLIMLPLL